MEISRARYRAELVTDDAARLRERLETATGERIAALEAVAPDAPAKEAETPGKDAARPEPERAAPVRPPAERDGKDMEDRDRRPSQPAREKPLERDFGLELEL